MQTINIRNFNQGPLCHCQMQLSKEQKYKSWFDREEGKEGETETERFFKGYELASSIFPLRPNATIFCQGTK